MKTKYALGLIFLFMLAIFLAEYPFSKKIDTQIPAVLSVADTPYPYESSDSGAAATTYTDTPTVIRVQGDVSKKVFRQPEFNVTVTVDGFGWMTDGRHFSRIIRSERIKGINMGTLQHTYDPKYSDSDWTKYIKTSLIWFDDDFEQVHLSTSTREWMGEPEEEARALKITGKAADEAGALEVRRKLGEVYPDWFDF